ncbi:hypothetical protein BdWA1_002407 [Babesia duncani]|uniref:Uncharacterized protein n=1 Tax=Babesia duncani TaxID=323732 RepID=A0AAD9PJW0_9APIC|nr:hypothetical protein BdWA1_002407 [Babesia duncani]
MWQDKLFSKFGKRYDGYECSSTESDDSIEQEESDKNLQKILSLRVFNRNVFDPYIKSKQKLRLIGWCFVFGSGISLLALVYLSYHCYFASCNDCMQNIEHQSDQVSIYDQPAPFMTDARDNLQVNYEKRCDFVVCVYNYFYNPKTHFEKCYYALVLFHASTAYFIFWFVSSIAWLLFKHSNIHSE